MDGTKRNVVTVKHRDSGPAYSSQHPASAFTQNTTFVALDGGLTTQQHLAQVSWQLLGVAANQRGSLGTAADYSRLARHYLRFSGDELPGSVIPPAPGESGDPHSELLHFCSVIWMWKGSSLPS